MTKRAYVVVHDAIGATLDDDSHQRGPWLRGEILDDSAFDSESVKTEPDHLIAMGAIRPATAEEAKTHFANPQRLGAADVPSGGWAARRAAARNNQAAKPAMAAVADGAAGTVIDDRITTPIPQQITQPRPGAAK
jgi:hypothetical protein